MRRPAKVVVGGWPFSITWLSEDMWLKTFDEEYIDKAGRCSTGSLTIDIRTGYGGTESHPEVLKEILLHEIIHACFGITNLNNTLLDLRKKDIEEAVTGALSISLVAVLRENRSVRDYLFS